ncbi:MAG: transglutaminase N-terminal domain-containing protein, partial [Anaerovoracaceae bacterium]
MKELHFEYRMKLAFASPVCRHRFTLKCTPISNERQIIEDMITDVYPKEFLATSRDSFGNSCIYGYSEGEHDHFSVSVTGRAVTGLSPFEKAREPYQLGLFKYQTDYTRPGTRIRDLYDSIPLRKNIS